jgi:type IV pilus biogenesis protein CpaD/CtpE
LKQGEFNVMKLPVMAAVAIVLLSACANQDGAQQANMSQNQNKQQPSNFQSIGSCEPTAWAGLERDSRKLSPDQRQRVMVLLQDAQSQHAEANQGQCIMTLQQAEKIVRQGMGAS